MIEIFIIPKHYKDRITYTVHARNWDCGHYKPLYVITQTGDKETVERLSIDEEGAELPKEFDFKAEALLAGERLKEYLRK